eukprot:3240042-Alexandrium_andersonii.AAC.1
MGDGALFFPSMIGSIPRPVAQAHRPVAPRSSPPCVLCPRDQASELDAYGLSAGCASYSCEMPCWPTSFLARACSARKKNRPITRKQ